MVYCFSVFIQFLVFTYYLFQTIPSRVWTCFSLLFLFLPAVTCFDHCMMVFLTIVNPSWFICTYSFFFHFQVLMLFIKLEFIYWHCYLWLIYLFVLSFTFVWMGIFYNPFQDGCLCRTGQDDRIKATCIFSFKPSTCVTQVPGVRAPLPFLHWTRTDISPWLGRLHLQLSLRQKPFSLHGGNDSIPQSVLTWSHLKH